VTAKNSDFIKFCESHKIGTDKIKWKVKGDRGVKVSVNKSDLSKGSWSLLSIVVQFAMKEIGLQADITFQESAKTLDITIEK